MHPIQDGATAATAAAAAVATIAGNGHLETLAHKRKVDEAFFQRMVRFP